MALLSRLADLYRGKGFAQRALSLYLEAASRAWIADFMDQAVTLLVRCVEIDPESRNVRSLLRSIFKRSGNLREGAAAGSLFWVCALLSAAVAVAARIRTP